MVLQTRPESVTREKMRILAEMNIPIEISCGVESGSERILNELCNRKMKISDVKNAFGLMHEFKICSKAYVMIGFPTETREEIFETIALVRQINPDISIMSTFYPLYGTPLRKYCLDHSFIDGNEEICSFTERSVLKGQTMSAEEIFNLRRVYRLYTVLPEEMFPKIELCEKNFSENKRLFDELIELSWQIREKRDCV